MADEITWPLRDALDIASDVLDGRRTAIEGSIALAQHIGTTFPEWKDDADLLLFVAVASETDHLPINAEQRLWSAAALAKADAEIAAIEDLHRERVKSACANIIGRYGKSGRAVTLYRPVGPKELELIAASGWRQYPPRLPEQPIFYPVTNEAYAIQIARDWNVRESGAGFVTRFQVDSYFLSRYAVQKVGGAMHTEYWIPAEELAEFNANIVGAIEVTVEFHADPQKA